MNQTCPQCYSQLTSSEVGNLCVTCGYLQRRHHNHAPARDEDDTIQQEPTHQHADHALPGNLEAPRGLDELLFSNSASTETTSVNKPLEEVAPTPEQVEKPQIINHRTSSQYRRRLAQQIETLETPEIESPIEPESSLEAADIPTPVITPDTATANEDSARSAPTPSLESIETQDDSTEDAPKPHRPSPYLLNMSDAEEAKSMPHPEYVSPLDSAAKHTPNTPPNPQPAMTDAPKPEADVALARADALLAAAATTQKTAGSSKANYIIIAITIVLILGVGSFLAFNLLKKPTSQNTPQQTIASTPSASQNSSPTPTNLTESAKRDSERKDSLNTIAIALAAYKKANGTYPNGNDIEVLSALTSSNPPYLREIKTDPLSNPENGVIIKYGYTSDGTKFTLTASLENKQDSDAVNGLYVVKSP